MKAHREDMDGSEEEGEVQCYREAGRATGCDCGVRPAQPNRQLALKTLISVVGLTGAMRGFIQRKAGFIG